REELDAVVAPYVGHDVDFSDLQKVVAAISALYSEKRVVTGIATLPPQSVAGGVVHIKLTEGRLGKFSMTGRQHTGEGYITDRVEPPKPGEVLDVPKLSRDVTWFNRTNDVQLRALLQPARHSASRTFSLPSPKPPPTSCRCSTTTRVSRAPDVMKEASIIVTAVRSASTTGSRSTARGPTAI